MSGLSIRLAAIVVISLGFAANCLSQSFGWLTETAFCGFFTWENCKQVQRLAYDDRYLNRKKWAKNERLTEGDVEFDSLGRPIRSSCKSWELAPEHLPNITRYIYADSQVTTFSTYQYHDGSIKEGIGVHWFAHDNRIDSLFSEQKFIHTITKYVTRIFRTASGRVAQVVNWSSSQEPNRVARLQCDTASYTYDAEGRVASYQWKNIEWKYEYLTADSVVVRGNEYYGMDLAVKLNEKGLPLQMTAMTRQGAHHRKQHEISRVYFYYQMR